jgi:hypothetical protein
MELLLQARGREDREGRTAQSVVLPPQPIVINNNYDKPSQSVVLPARASEMDEFLRAQEESVRLL